MIDWQAVQMTPEVAELREARNFLLHHRTDYATAYSGFRWPRFRHFNFALDWVDYLGRERDKEALRIVSDRGPTVSRTFADLSQASNRIANFLRSAGAKRGDIVLIMLNNTLPLWETMLAVMKLGGIIIPATPLLSRSELSDRIERGGARFVIAASAYTERFEVSAGWRGISVGEASFGWLSLDASEQFSSEFDPDGQTAADDPLLMYFTSGTTTKPKLAVHSHVSYPVGHLSTMYWLGLTDGDIHLNISSPGWAKHAWSCVFAPWLAEATVLVLDHQRFSAAATLDAIVSEGVTTFCAPPTVWRHLIQEDLSYWKPKVREAASAGEPLNPEVISRIEDSWGTTIRDGFGQTECCAIIGNSPGQPVTPGAMGRPLPGFAIELQSETEDNAMEGEISVELRPDRPVGIMEGYYIDGAVQPISGSVFRTGDIAQKDVSGYYTYVGRADDVFKASDYRISPFELESALLEHPAVVEAAVVPSPDAARYAVPKAFVLLAPGFAADGDTAIAILAHAAQTLGPFKRVRRLEFSDLPKTVSGKIRRVELRRLEAERRASGLRVENEWFEEDFTNPSAARGQ
jgi:acetyl-CoA synthetase